jgi:hypothetical protein
MIMKFGIYEVEEEYDDKGQYRGYRCSVGQATGIQGKLYVRSDGRENYQAASPPEETTSDDLEI